jgi:hypothetical protein
VYQIAQDIANKEQCFLSAPEWRALPEQPLDSLDMTSIGIQLRTQLTDFLLDLPELLARAQLLLTAPAPRIDDGLKSLSSYTTGLKRRIEFWYERAVFPHICPQKPRDIREIMHISDREYPELLFIFLDCVICSLLVKLDDLLNALESAHVPQELKLPSSPSNISPYMIRREVARSALILVQARSTVTAKQLSFGLNHLESQFKGYS